jgi:hypothetical protein
MSTPHPYPLRVALLALMAGLIFKRKVHAKLGLAGALRQALAAGVLERVDFPLSVADEAR